MNAGVRYQSELSDDDHDLNRVINQAAGVVDLSFLRRLNDNAGDRWTVPVTGYLKFRF
jgi:hypothetical protein